jgi:hypothetical protein
MLGNSAASPVLRKEPAMRVPHILTALALSTGLLLTAPAAASADGFLSSSRLADEVGPAPLLPGVPPGPPAAATSPPTPPSAPGTDPVDQLPALPTEDPIPVDEPVQPVQPTATPPTSDDAPSEDVPDVVVVPEQTPAPAAPPSTDPAPSGEPSAPAAEPATTASPAPERPQPAVDEAVGVAGLEGPTADRPSSSSPTSTRLLPSPSGTLQTQADEAVADATVGAATGPSPRYVAAGILSLVAVALALGIAVVSQPRRPRRTH